MNSSQRLLLLFGGRSAEHDISIRSAEEVRAAVDPSRFQLVPIGITREGAFRTGDPAQPFEQIIKAGKSIQRPLNELGDVAFPLLHGPFGEDGCIQGYFESLSLPYVGSGVAASALCMDKTLCRRMLGASVPPQNGVVTIPMVQALELHKRDLRLAQANQLALDFAKNVGFPCFIKPANLGSSIGIEKVSSEEQMSPALERAWKHDPKLLLEQGIDARELEVAVLGTGDDETLVSDVGEIVLPADQWYDYESKYENDVAKLSLPAQVDDLTRQRLRSLALEVFRQSGCYGLARIDFFMDRGNQALYLNEINTLPGFTTISMYPKLMEHAGVPYSQLITKLVDLALAR